jgi:DNA-binding transcriptional MerR regulator
VGQLTRLTGLTVRTPSGHRLYDEQDVQRLYQFVALHELGLPLEVIGELLDG